jgi:SAM-dependent methyltransferase
MTDQRKRSTVFGEVAELYDRARPSYPSEAVDTLAAHGGRGAVLELGSGTGKLTRSLAPLARRLVAVEPDPAMADVARRSLSASRQVEVVVSAWEAYDAPAAAFDLVVVGQAWHWFDKATRLARAARAIRPAGWLALLWNNPVVTDARFQAELDAAYQRHAPQILDSGASGPIDAEEQSARSEISASPSFGDPETSKFDWSVRYTTREHADLLMTLSGFRMLEPARRDALIADMSALIDARGGVVEQAYTCHVVLGQRTRTEETASSRPR